MESLEQILLRLTFSSFASHYMFALICVWQLRKTKKKNFFSRASTWRVSVVLAGDRLEPRSSAQNSGSLNLAWTGSCSRPPSCRPPKSSYLCSKEWGPISEGQWPRLHQSSLPGRQSAGTWRRIITPTSPTSSSFERGGRRNSYKCKYQLWSFSQWIADSTENSKDWLPSIKLMFNLWLQPIVSCHTSH